MYHVTNVARVAPDKPAAIFSPSRRTITFGDLERQANQAARALLDLGVERGDCVGISITNRPEFLVAMLGAQRIGAYYTLLSTKLSVADLAYIVDDCEAKVVIVSGDCFAAEAPAELRQVRSRVFGIDLTEGVEGDWLARLAAASTSLPDHTSGGRVMLYSSGTTGRPKGIRKPLPDGPFDAVEAPNRAISIGYGLDDGSVVISPAPLYHAAPHRYVSAALHAGATCIVHEHFDAAQVLQDIGAYRCTHGLWVPTMFHRMLQLPDDVRDAADVSSQRYAIHGAAPCPPHIKRRMIEWWGPILDEYYSGSEGVGSTRITSQEWLQHEGSVGKPTGCVVHILGDDGEERPVGEAGDVYFEGDNAFEYWRDPEKSKAVVSRQGWRTFGDVGYVDAEGYLYLTDRRHFTINSGGVNIYPQEIEAALLEHPDVQDVAVIGTPHDAFGQEVTAVVQLTKPSAASEEFATVLRAYVRSRLGPIKTPRRVVFEPELPRHATGKLFKNPLIEKYSAAPGSETPRRDLGVRN